MTRRWAPFVAVELATVLAGIANGITMVAFPWLVLEVTGSAAAAGTIAAITAVPMVVASFFSGTIVDRFGRRASSVVSDLLSLASVLLVPAAAALDRLDITLLAVVAVLGAVFDPTGVTAREAMLPGAAKAARLPLERVNGVHEALWNVAFVIGPGVGGLLIGLVGATATFWATAVAFALSALAIALVPIPGGERPPRQVDAPGMGRATADGLRFLWRDPLLRALALFYTVLVAGWMPIQSVVLPAWFQSRDAPEALGTVLLMSSVGAIVGALTYAAIGHRTQHRARLFVIAAVLMSVPVALLALLPPLWAVIALMTFSGLFWGPVNPMVNLAIQRRTPPQLLGRITGLIGSVAFAAAPLGYVVAGWSYEAAGPAVTMGLLGGLLVVASLALALVPAVRLLDRLPAQPPAEVPVAP
jgi:MFS family permease